MRTETVALSQVLGATHAAVLKTKLKTHTSPEETLCRIGKERAEHEARLTDGAHSVKIPDKKPRAEWVTEEPLSSRG